jgi:hypothetical protein
VRIGDGCLASWLHYLAQKCKELLHVYKSIFKRLSIDFFLCKETLGVVELNIIAIKVPDLLSE